MNSEIWKKVWYEGGLQLADIGTKNVREYGLNARLGYAILRHENWHNTCTRGVIGNIIFWRAKCSYDSNRLIWYGLDSMSLKC